MHYGRSRKMKERRNNGWNIPNLSREMNIQVQEAQFTSSGINPKRPKLRCSTTKPSKIKGKLESSKKKATWHVQGAYGRLPANFSGETLQNKRQWRAIFKLLKENKNKKPYQLRYQINNLTLYLKEIFTQS